MKQWNKDDLILFYYAELDRQADENIRAALADSKALQKQYTELCDFLDVQINATAPLPDRNFNQRIMASVYRQADSQASQSLQKSAKIKSGLMAWLLGAQWARYAGASMLSILLVVGVFSIGRWSAQLNPNVAQTATEISLDQFEPLESTRVLFSSVSDHLEVGGRLLRSVSNDDLPQDFRSRGQNIEDLIAFNRLYRRIVEQSGDKQLAHLLQQMEQVLIELNHTDGQAEDLQNIKDRLEKTDLIYRLHISNKRLGQKIKYI